MGSLGLTHWLIVLAIAVVIFGTKRLRNIGSDLGVALRDFRKGLNEAEHSEPAQLKADSPTTSASKTDSKREHAE